jgi:heptosyltransferase-2
LAATVVQTKSMLSCQPCQSTICRMNDHRCMRDILHEEVVAIVQRVLSETAARVST